MKHKIVYWMSVLSMLATALVLIGCTALPPATPVDAPAGAVETEFSAPGFKPAWSAEIARLLKNGALAKLNAGKKDMVRFCPKYNSLSEDGQITAWLYLLSGVVSFESGKKERSDEFYRTDSGMKESTGQNSLGLFQMSYKDPYDGCPKSKAGGDLFDPIVNIRCGISAMASLVAKYGVITFGGAERAGAPKCKGLACYWSVLRIPDPHAYEIVDSEGHSKTVQSKHHLADIIAIAQKAPGCH